MDMFLIIAIVVAALVVFGLLVAVFLRTVVPTNEVHIVQSSKTTISYGKDHAAGNTYYGWPSWIPKIGIVSVALPVSVFDQELNAYAGYDKGRVPFQVDVKAFFRIIDSNIAAQRVSSLTELSEQLRGILQGAIRTILASVDIEEILEGRGKFGDMFTKEVDEQLRAWGVGTVKNIELMDIRDAEGSQVIANIMEKKKSLIEKESRMAVAGNIKEAEMAEIDAKREVDIRAQEAAQIVGQRTAEKDKAVGVANEQAQQTIKEQKKTTAEKDMAVKQVEEVKKAEINKEVNVVKAEEKKRTDVIIAEGEKQKTVLVAEGKLQETSLESQGITLEGKARAEAEKLMQLAPVEAQIVLAKEIGENVGYQDYLIKIRVVEKDQAVGIETAKALEKSDLKVIVNTGDVQSGVSNLMDIFSPKGGTAIGGMLEALKQTDAGKAVISNLLAPAAPTTPSRPENESPAAAIARAKK